MSVSDTAVLLEREAVLDAVERDLAAARAGSGRLVLITGPAGIGKSAVLAAVRVRAQGMVVARARGAELEGGYAFGVVRQLFEPVLRGCSRGERARLFGRGAGPARDVLGMGSSEVTGGGGGFPEVMHGLYSLALNVAERRSLLVLIDDAHWADPPSVRFVSYLAGRLDGAAILVVVAVRGADRPGADGTLGAVAREDTTRLVQLASLSPQATSALLRSEYGEPVAPEFATACLVATGGNPFFLRELIRALRADGVSPTADQAGRVARLGPPSVARSVLTRIMGLSSAARPVARALAMLGGEARLRDVAGLSSLEEATVAIAIDELRAAGVTVGFDPVAFAHPIVNAAIYADTAPGERDRDHRRAACLLAAGNAEVERVAAHLVRTRPVADAWAASVLKDAAGEALRRGAPDSAVVYLERALAEPPASGDRVGVVASLGRCEYLAHQPGGAGHLLEAMGSAVTVRARAEFALQAAQALMVAEPDASEAAIEILDRAIGELADPHSQLSMRLEARLLAAAGLKLSTRRLHVERLDGVFARSLGEDDAASLLLINLAFWTLLEGRTPGRFEDLAVHVGGGGCPADVAGRVAQRALADGRLLREDGCDSELFLFATGTLFYAEFLDQAQHWVERALEDARRRGSVQGYALTSATLAEVAYRRGDLPSAEAHARAAAEISAEDAAAVLVNILIEQGHVDEAARVLEPFRIPPDADHLLLQPIRYARARLRIAQGRIQEATNELLMCADWLRAWPAENPSFIAWRSRLALVLAGVGQRDRARELATEELALARRLGQPRTVGIALRALGLVEHDSRGVDLLRGAATELGRTSARLELARALIDYGSALRRLGHRIDARAPLREGLDLAHTCGATVLAQTAHQELLASGARPRRRALRGRDALTPTEARIADMAAHGDSTPEIAQALFVTTKTVETHLGHAYQKLDIHSRDELAAALSRRESSGDLERAARD